MWPVLLDATYDTIKILFITTFFTVLLGMPLGFFLEATQNDHILGGKYLWLHKLLINLINFFNNIPIFLLIIMLIPIINQILLDYFTIELSAIAVMILINLFIFAKDVFISLNSIPKELSDTAKFLGMTPLQILIRFLLPESLKNLIDNISKLIINTLGISIIFGYFGVKGLGKLALEKSNEELDLSYMVYIILLSATLVYLIKFSSNYIINIIYKK